MEKIINLLINNWTKGVDTYTHNGSTWLIFSESKQWVIELTESKTLWYNYSFFKELFSLTSMDVVDNQHYITKWVEDNIINKVKDTILEKNITEGEVEEIIENGFKGIKNRGKFTFIHLDDIIQNGVKETNHVDVMKFFDNKMDDALENGIKETHDDAHNHKDRIDGVIKGGVKHTEIGWHQCNNIDDAIENGVIETKGDTSQNPMGKVTKVIKNGIKESIAAGYKDPNTRLVYVKWLDEIDEVLENGVKETKTPSNGDIVSFAEWMKENNSTSYPKLIDDVIENGIKETLVSGSWNNDKMDEVIENGKLVSGTFVGGKRQKEDVESVIGYGTKNPSV
jgi:predicted peroxiredoxin